MIEIPLDDKILDLMAFDIADRIGDCDDYNAIDLPEDAIRRALPLFLRICLAHAGAQVTVPEVMRVGGDADGLGVTIRCRSIPGHGPEVDVDGSGLYGDPEELRALSAGVAMAAAWLEQETDR